MWDLPPEAVPRLPPWRRGRPDDPDWDRPQGRDEDDDSWDRPQGRGEEDFHGRTNYGGSCGSGVRLRPPMEPARAPNRADRAHPQGKGADWSGWRDLNPGAPRRSVLGAEAREKAKEGIMQDGLINMLVACGISLSDQF